MKDYGPTILRIVVGIVYVMHSYVALARFTPAGTAAFMANVGLPAPALTAWIVIAVHGLGGLLLILGLWTRWAAAANAIIMLVALVKVHLPQGFFLKVMAGGASVGGFEFVLLLLAATVALILAGSGALAIKRSR
ncbi:MAG: DoxX family protein [Candidatus Rokubacteria bacterium]|nr:DoxX family protein [Candidatus Rokubacteria bacterium]